MIRTFSFNTQRLHDIFAPRKPRHPLLRLALGLLGLAVLVTLVFLGVFIGAAMLAVGMVSRMLRPRQRHTAQPGVVEGEYHVIRKQTLPSSH